MEKEGWIIVQNILQGETPAFVHSIFFHII